VGEDHRFIKKITSPMIGFKSFHTEKTIVGIKVFHMIRKEQLEIPPVLSNAEWIQHHSL
jgi:IS6 family transposase